MADSGAVGGLSAASGGIAEALVTTAVDVTVAIVSVWFYNFFVNKVDHIRHFLHRSFCLASLVPSPCKTGGPMGLQLALQATSFPSKSALRRHITAFLEDWNRRPTLFVWTKPAQTIIRHHRRMLARISRTEQ